MSRRSELPLSTYNFFGTEFYLRWSQSNAVLSQEHKSCRPAAGLIKILLRNMFITVEKTYVSQNWHLKRGPSPGSEQQSAILQEWNRTGSSEGRRLKMSCALVAEYETADTGPKRKIVGDVPPLKIFRERSGG